MRAILVASLMLPTIASANPKGVVWKDRVHEATRSGGPVALTSVSHTLFLNNCLPNGCTVAPGFDNSLTNHSSIADSTVTLSAYAHGDAHWQKLVDCVKETFRPFNIDIVTADPGNTSHFEVMIGGTSTQLNSQLTNAGGVAPFIGCDATDNNAISFVFAGQSADINYLCGAVAQEASHVWGLDHELDADDPMTYLDLGSLKRFQNSNPQCGEELGSPRGCQCGGNTQNSFTYLRDTFGLSPTLGDTTLTITKPRDGQWVAPSFPIAGVIETALSMAHGALSYDGAQTESFGAGMILAWNAPTTLAPGAHTIKLEVTDTADRPATASISVKVMATCAAGTACASGLSCFGGLCVPGADEVGGLGAGCTSNDDCATGHCASDNHDSLCTGACEAGACPSGMECITESNLCWPTASGGCSVTTLPSSSDNSAKGALLMFALGGLLLVRRRRGSHIVKA